MSGVGKIFQYKVLLSDLLFHQVGQVRALNLWQYFFLSGYPSEYFVITKWGVVRELTEHFLLNSLYALPALYLLIQFRLSPIDGSYILLLILRRLLNMMMLRTVLRRHHRFFLRWVTSRSETPVVTGLQVFLHGQGFLAGDQFTVGEGLHEAGRVFVWTSTWIGSRGFMDLDACWRDNFPSRVTINFLSSPSRWRCRRA